MSQHDPEMEEYLALKRQAQGKKPPAAGRTWRRAATAIIPESIREPLTSTLGETTGIIVGLSLISARMLLPAGVGFAVRHAGEALIPWLAWGMQGNTINHMRGVEAALQSMLQTIGPVALLAGSIMSVGLGFSTFLRVRNL